MDVYVLLPVNLILIACGLVIITLARDCLQCYQCASLRNDTFPYCDDNYWHALTKSKKESLIVGCPSKKAKFCGKIEENITGNRVTKRACLGSHDSRGHKLKEGCLKYIKEGSKFALCFCQNSLCNSGRSSDFKLSHSHSVLSLVLVLILVVKDNLC